MNSRSIARMRHHFHTTFHKEDEAAMNVSSIATIAIALVVIVLASYIAVAVLAALIAPYASNIKNLSANFTSADWGNETANSLGTVVGLIVSLGGMLAFLGLAIWAIFHYLGGQKHSGF